MNDSQSLLKMRILRVLEHHDISKSELAKSSNMSRAKVDRILSGDSVITASFIEQFLSIVPSVSPTWLLTGAGAIYTGATNRDKELRLMLAEANLITLDEFSNQSSAYVQISAEMWEAITEMLSVWQRIKAVGTEFHNKQGQ